MAKDNIFQSWPNSHISHWNRFVASLSTFLVFWHFNKNYLTHQYIFVTSFQLCLCSMKYVKMLICWTILNRIFCHFSLKHHLLLKKKHFKFQYEDTYILDEWVFGKSEVREKCETCSFSVTDKVDSITMSIANMVTESRMNVPQGKFHPSLNGYVYFRSCLQVHTLTHTHRLSVVYFSACANITCLHCQAMQ